jgi:hypothetical protein
MGIAGGVERMYYARQFPRSRYPGQLPLHGFRKEKNREFPRSSRLESYQLK